MAIIYTYPVVTPTADDYILGTDATDASKPTKNFTIQSIIDLITGDTQGLSAVLTEGNDAGAQAAINFTNLSGSGSVTFGSFTDGTLTITGGNLTTTGNGTFTNITGTLQTAAQPNVTSLGTLTSLSVNTSVTGTAVVTTLTAPGDNLKIASTKAIVDYVGTNPPGAESLAATLAVGNTTGGTDIAVSAGDDITFTNTSKLLMGTTTADILEIYGDSSDSFIIDKSPGALKLQTSLLSVLNEAGAETILTGTDGGSVDLYYDNTKRLETLNTGAKVTGAFEATTTGTFAGVINSGAYTDSSGDVGSAGQILTSTVTGTNWVTEAPLYTWIIEADSGTGSPYTVASGDTIDFVGVGSISTAWDNATKELRISSSNPDGSGAANQVTYWSDADTITGAAGFTFAGGATGKVTVAGELEAGTLSDGTFSGSSGTYTGGVSITSTTFVGALTGNADTATALASAGTIQLDAGSGATLGVGSDAVTYTSGGNITLTTTLQNTTVTGKTLTGLPTPAAASVTAADTILEGIGKLQSQINGIANGLQYQGTWNANTNSPTLASGGGEATSGTTTSTTANKLVDSGANFTATVTIGDKVINQVDGQTALVSAIDSATVLALDADIMLTGEAYTIDNSPFITQGHYYVVSVAGSTSLNGISDWVVGDWVIAGATNVWEKLDNTAVQGTGTANYLTKWNATGVSAIVDSGVTDDGSTIKLLNDVELGNTASDTLLVKGPTTFDENVRFDKSISIGAAYGTAGQVLTSGGGSGAINTWTTPSSWGYVESVTASDGILIGGTAVDPTVAIRYADSDAAGTIKNAIEVVATAAPVATDMLWFSDADANTNINEIKKATIADIVDLGNETLSEVLSNGNTTGATKISVNNSSSGVDLIDDTKIRFGDIAGTPDLEIYHTAGANSIIKATVSSPTAGPLLIQSDNLELQASSVSEKFLTTSVNAELNLFYNNVKKFETTATGIKVPGTILELEGATPTLTIDDSTTNAGDLTVNVGSSIATYTSEGESTGPTYGQHVFKQKDGPSGTLRTIMTLAADQNVDLVGGIDTSTHLTTSGVVKTSDGSAGAPAYTFSSEATLGLYRAGADILGIDANTIRYRMGSATHAQLSYSASSVEFNVGNGLTTSTTGKLIIEGLCKTTIEQNLSVTGAGVTFTYGYNATPADGGNLQFTSSNGTVLNLKNDRTAQLNDYGSGTNTGTAVYNLEVDSSGNIIETSSTNPSGKGGIFHGSKTFTAGAAASNLFTLTRANTGTLVFDVWLTSGDSSSESICKRYTVARAHAVTTTVPYNKLIDSGPDGSNDFTVSFLGDATTGVECKIAATGADQTVSYTVQVGYDSVNALTVA